jgi:hypothetical protein
MNRRRLVAVVVALLLLSAGSAGSAFAKGRSSSGHSRASSSKSSVHVRSYTRKNGTVVAAHTRSAPHARAVGSHVARAPRAYAPRAASVRTRPSAVHATTNRQATGSRTATNHEKRSAAAKDAFERQTGYPHGRPGYVVDHIKPLACGGADAPANMQWQTIAEGKAKDKTERIGCR